MFNSVKNRGNASSSGAGHFIEEHLCGEGWKAGYDTEPEKKWIHLDIASPSTTSNGRATGFGVALLCEVVERISKL